ncbi:MAG: DUF4250 domain-containing protein [Muribaculaceae bacterium]|nr:DUF4250 domain-containing protein [Muribaculaceae bacterium]MDE7156210.1 DUF4250 domain-containing protein [Muribaculaceae bacterium]MDE7368949.1 DUF4250 domain-containing protein [Muribaculaceae bacterium]
MLNTNLPQDPIMLYSYINTLLRDRYDSLEKLCDDMEIDKKELEEKLQSVGMVYEPLTNQFR